MCIRDSELLYARLETRVHRMMEIGLLSEVRALLESGVAPAAQSMQGIGYKELIPVIMGQGDEMCIRDRLCAVRGLCGQGGGAGLCGREHGRADRAPA